MNKRIGVLDSSVPPPAPYSALNAPDNPNLPECMASVGLQGRSFFQLSRQR